MASTSTHPYVPLRPWKDGSHRPLLPVHPPPGPLNYPSLPSPPRKLASSAPFILSTHILPAAYLRRGPFIPLPDLPPSDASQAERSKAYAEIHGRIWENCHSPEFKNAQHENVLWNVANRYARKGLTGANSTGITLLFGAANGYPKEIWEPILCRIFSSSAGNLLDEVWVWDASQHGDSGLLNVKALSGFYDWHDNACDLLNFFLHFLPSTTLDAVLPTHLPRIPSEETQKRISSGFEHRKVITIGHSYNGTCMALAASEYPTLFSSLILVDPVMVRPDLPPQSLQPIDRWGSKAIAHALTRRDTWSSKEEAYAEFASSPFFQTWDPETLRFYIEYGLYETSVNSPSGETKQVVKLKLPGVHEALVFAEGFAHTEAFSQMPRLNERVRLHWIMSGAKGATEFGPPGSQQERVWVRPKNASNVRIMRAGHLVPQEGTAEFAQVLTQFLQQHYPSTCPPQSKL